MLANRAELILKLPSFRRSFSPRQLVICLISPLTTNCTSSSIRVPTMAMAEEPIMNTGQISRSCFVIEQASSRTESEQRRQPGLQPHKHPKRDIEYPTPWTSTTISEVPHQSPRLNSSYHVVLPTLSGSGNHCPCESHLRVQREHPLHQLEALLITDYSNHRLYLFLIGPAMTCNCLRYFRRRYLMNIRLGTPPSCQQGHPASMAQD